MSPARWPTDGRVRREFGELQCTAGIPDSGRCRCRLCELEYIGDMMLTGNHFHTQDGRRIPPEWVTIGVEHAREGDDQTARYYIRGSAYDHRADYTMDAVDWPVETVTPITQVPAGVADTLLNGERFARETKMTNHEMFNPAARDGKALFVGLRMIPVALILALVFQAVAG